MRHENLLIVHLFPFTVATLQDSSSPLLFTDSPHSSTNSFSSIHTIRAVCHFCTPRAARGRRARAQLLWSCYCETVQNGGHDWSGTIWKSVIWSQTSSFECIWAQTWHVIRIQRCMSAKYIHTYMSTQPYVWTNLSYVFMHDFCDAAAMAASECCS